MKRRKMVGPRRWAEGWALLDCAHDTPKTFLVYPWVMTKADLVDVIAAEGDISKPQAQRCFDAVVMAIVEALKQGEKVELRGFGSFRARQRASRVGRNPKTGVGVAVPAKRVPFFKPGKDLREALLDR